MSASQRERSKRAISSTFQVPGEEETAVLHCGFFERILHERNIEWGAPLRCPRQFHLSAERKLAPSAIFASIESQILPLVAAASIAFNIGGAKWKRGPLLKQVVGPLGDFCAELHLVLSGVLGNHWRLYRVNCHYRRSWSIFNAVTLSKRLRVHFFRKENQ